MNSPATIQGPGQLLATIPTLLGFEPRESIVVVGILPSGLLGVVMRVDRADCLIPEVAAVMGRSIGAQLARDGATRAVLVSYTSQDVRVGCDAMDALHTPVSEAVRRTDHWAVTDGTYFGPGCADVTCCPPQGSPLPAPAATGAEVQRLRGTWHDDPRAVPVAASKDERRKASRAGDRWWRRRDKGLDRWRCESWARWAKALESSLGGQAALIPTEAGKIIASLADVHVRDAAVLSMIPGGTGAAQRLVEGCETSEVAHALKAVLSPHEGTPPDPAMMATAYALVSHLNALSRPHSRAPLHTLVALMSWWEGDPLAALAWCDKALASEPGYRLAELLSATVRCHIAPGWSREM